MQTQMTKWRRLVLVGLSTLSMFGCASTTGDEDGATSQELSSGFDFERALDLSGAQAEVKEGLFSWASASGDFDAERYAAATFVGTEGQKIWYSAQSAWRTRLGYYGTTALVFGWAGAKGCQSQEIAYDGNCNVNDGKNWTLLSRTEQSGSGSVFADNAGSASQWLVLPRTGRYLVIVLAEPEAYARHAGYSIYIRDHGTVQSTPNASMEGLVTCSDHATPVVGAKVQVDADEVTTDQSGHFKLTTKHVPNDYAASITRGDRPIVNMRVALIPGTNLFHFDVDCP